MARARGAHEGHWTALLCIPSDTLCRNLHHLPVYVQKRQARRRKESKLLSLLKVQARTRPEASPKGRSESPSLVNLGGADACKPFPAKLEEIGQKFRTHTVQHSAQLPSEGPVVGTSGIEVAEQLLSLRDCPLLRCPFRYGCRAARSSTFFALSICPHNKAVHQAWYSRQSGAQSPFVVLWRSRRKDS
eukprot:scaffold259_cov252-Pinguiococcus_pyrenoidosus.AAC.6